MNILIIGASGFVANCLIKRLSNRKDLRILAVSRNIGHVAEEFNDSENVFFQKFDFLNDDPSKFDFSSDVVINLMSQQPSSDQISWQNYIEGNVKTVSSLLDTIKIQNVGKIIQFSTSSVYSSSQSPINDLTEPQPDNYYGLSKFMPKKQFNAAAPSIPRSSEVLKIAVSANTRSRSPTERNENFPAKTWIRLRPKYSNIPANNPNSNIKSQLSTTNPRTNMAIPNTVKTDP